MVNLIEQVDVLQKNFNNNSSDIDYINCMSEIANQLNIQLYLIDFNSELNNLNNKWNIFLNTKQPSKKIISDFLALLEVYRSEQQK